MKADADKPRAAPRFPSPRRARRRAVRGTAIPGGGEILALGAGRTLLGGDVRRLPGLQRSAGPVSFADWPHLPPHADGRFDRIVILDPALWTHNPVDLFAGLAPLATATARLGLVAIAPGSLGSLVEAYAGLSDRRLRPFGPDQILTFGMAAGWQLLEYRQCFPGYASALLTRMPKDNEAGSG